MTNDQVEMVKRFDRERDEMVRALRRIADRFADEFPGPDARAVGRVYRAAAGLVDTLTWMEFSDVAKAMPATEPEQATEA